MKSVHFDADRLSVELMDGRRIAVPVRWFPRLANATPQQRCNWEIIGAGFGIHWPDLGEDLSTAGLLRGEQPHIVDRGRRTMVGAAARSRATTLASRKTTDKNATAKRKKPSLGARRG